MPAWVELGSALAQVEGSVPVPSRYRLGSGLRAGYRPRFLGTGSSGTAWRCSGRLVGTAAWGS